MYLEHFGLADQPFDVTPDSRFLFLAPAMHEALNVLLLGLRAGEGFLKVTGEVGTGKTLLCRTLVNRLAPEFVTAYIPNPQVTPAALNRALAAELDAPCTPNVGNHRVIETLQEALLAYHQQGRRVVLLLDEVQAMPAETLEALRLLTNLETETRKLLQVVVFGQPELDQRLARRNLRQLRQRITFSARLAPLSRDDLAAYLAHRLRVAGREGPPLLTARAVRLLHRGSGGIPRLANILAHKALLVAYGRGARRVTGTAVARAIRDTEAARRPARRLPWVATAAGAGLAGLAGALSQWGLAG